MSEERIIAALRALSESDGDVGAGPELEVRLRQAFRRRLAVRRWKRAAILTTAAACLLGAGLFLRRPAAAPVADTSDMELFADMDSMEQSLEPLAAAPIHTLFEERLPQESAAIVAKLPRKPLPRPREVVTEFFPLIDVAPEFGRGALMRVRVPAEIMLNVGLPVREDRLSDPIEADLLIGEEGLARAIRFVRVQ